MYLLYNKTYTLPSAPNLCVLHLVEPFFEGFYTENILFMQAWQGEIVYTKHLLQPSLNLEIKERKLNWLLKSNYTKVIALK